MKYNELPENLLLLRLYTGDAEAFEEIYLRYWQPLLRMARRKLHSQENAEELIQDLFVELWERRESLQVEDLRSYLHGAVKFKVLNHIKAQIIRQQYQMLHPSLLNGTSSETEEQIAYQDLYEAVQRTVAVLPEKTREIFRLNRLENRPASEISKLLEIPERTVEYHITQSIRTLRAHLKEFAVWVGVPLLFM